MAEFCAPSLVGAVLAGLGIGLHSSVHETSGLLQALAATGFYLLLAVPVGFVISLLAIALGRGWQLPEFLASLRSPTGAMPRLAAALTVAFLAVLFMGVASSRGTLFLMRSTKVLNLIVAFVPVVTVLLFLAVLCVSRPAYRLLAKWFEDVEAGAADGAPRFTLRRIVWVAALVVLASLFAVWTLSIRPVIGDLDVQVPRYLAEGLFLILVFPIVWQRIPTLYAKVLAAGVALGLVLCLASAAQTRYQDPAGFLRIWGRTPLAGWVVDQIYDVQSLRGEMQLGDIAPVETREDHPNIVLITVDTFRADQAKLYGGKARMPAFEKFANDGAVFERAYSPSNVTRRSIPSLVTGLSPARVHGRVVGWSLHLDPRHVLLAERLHEAGYQTRAFQCCASIFRKRTGLGLGFDEIDFERDGAKLSSKAATWLAARKKAGTAERPLFLWIHYFDPHSWEKEFKRSKETRSVRDRYLKSLESFDEELQPLLAAVEQDLGEDTLIVLTSDHGEGLGDHRSRYHSKTLYDSEIRVPLVISGPEIRRTRVQRVVGLADLTPTLLELAGFETPGMPTMDGRSFAGSLVGTPSDSGPGEAYAITIPDHSVPSGQAAIIVGDYKLIENAAGKFELYNLRKDPKERQNLKSTEKKLLEDMKAALRARKELDRVSPF